ncbi:MAG TPA: family 43 glycosylhydrolase [Paludibacter sp.]|nr:family 43 glycosylhydrolase [Paludibacter sp.]
MKTNLLKQIFLAILICSTGPTTFAQTPVRKLIENGSHLTDTQGNPIRAHGGGFLKVGKYYYWIGENRENGVLVSCYRSMDLLNWEFRGDLLTCQSHPELDKANIERPKVIYNELTGQFVMWMHYEYNHDYSYARAAVAVSTDIEKPFTFIKNFRPLGNMSRDCTLFNDGHGGAYFLSSARENYDMIMYKLTDDYLDIKEQVATLWPGGHREAPALVKHGDYYFMITSGCTGWTPNQAKYAYAKNIRGPWSELIDLGNATTFESQPTFILPVENNKSTSYIYIGDRWNAKQYANSSYVFLPLEFRNETQLELKWTPTFVPDLK